MTILRSRALATALAMAMAVVALSAAPSLAAPRGTATGEVPPGSAPARSGTPLRAAALRLIDEGAVGYSARVFDGRHREVLAVGTADLGTARPLRPDDRIEVGSNTKTLIATIALQLAGEHRLALSDPVERWLPGVVPGGRNITLRMLLNHTSGVYSYTDDPDWQRIALADPDRVWRPEELVAVGVRHAPSFPPGAGWEYSNTNYILAGMILHRVTGTPPADLIAQRIARPLHLKHTYLPVGAASTDSRRRARAYMVVFEADGTRTYQDTGTSSLSWAGTAGALMSTTQELERFFAALLGGRLLPASQLAEMRTTVPTAWPGTEYGLGLARSQTACGTAWGHGGDTLGHHTLAVFSADGRRSAVAVTTTQPGLEQDPSVPGFVTLFTDRERIDLQAVCQMFGRPLPPAPSGAAPSGAAPSGAVPSGAAPSGAVPAPPVGSVLTAGLGAPSGG